MRGPDPAPGPRSSTIDTAAIPTDTTGRSCRIAGPAAGDDRAYRARRDPGRARQPDRDPLTTSPATATPPEPARWDRRATRPPSSMRPAPSTAIDGPVRGRRVDHAVDHARQHQPADRHDRRPDRRRPARTHPRASRTTSVGVTMSPQADPRRHHEKGDAVDKSPFEIDIEHQADALRAFASAAPTDLSAVLAQHHSRIVLTGMGSSHFAALPTWRRLAAGRRLVGRQRPTARHPGPGHRRHATRGHLPIRCQRRNHRVVRSPTRRRPPGP